MTTTGQKTETGLGAISVGRAVQFLKDCVAEFKKISRPTGPETTQATIVTLVFMLIASLVLFVMDIIFSKITSYLLG